MRYFLEFAYNGSQYHGWQTQPNAKTVQETLTQAISTLLKVPIELVGAGRTDTGVHAKQMFAHFDSNISFDNAVLIQKLNSFLPADIVIYHIHPVERDAHARFDAISRTYEYHVHLFKDAFCNTLSYYHFRPLNLELMNEAAKTLLEYEDFECFSKMHTDVFTFNCTIFKAEWTILPTQNQLIFTISANRFLRNMVRAIVGTLINVGLERITLSDFRKIIESKDRGQAGFSVPGKGLFLTKIEYPYL